MFVLRLFAMTTLDLAEYFVGASIALGVLYGIYITFME